MIIVSVYGNAILSRVFLQYLLIRGFTDHTPLEFPWMGSMKISLLCSLIWSSFSLRIKIFLCLLGTSSLLSVCVPPTRHDVLHACDIAEDVAIAYGYDRVEEELPATFTIVKEQRLNRLTDMIRNEIALCGFSEALTFSLVSYRSKIWLCQSSISSWEVAPDFQSQIIVNPIF